jgi:hypothetical protein
MLGALFLVERHFWPGFSTRSHLAMGLVLTMAIYGALLTALCFRRLIDPWLPTPILAWILMWIWWVFEFLLDLMRPAPDVIIVEEVIIYDDDGGAHEDGMGYGWAIFMMLIGTACIWHRADALPREARTTFRRRTRWLASTRNPGRNHRGRNRSGIAQAGITRRSPS